MGVKKGNIHPTEFKQGQEVNLDSGLAKDFLSLGLVESITVIPEQDSENNKISIQEKHKKTKAKAKKGNK